VSISVIAAPNKRRGGDLIAEQAATFSTASDVLSVDVDLIKLPGSGTTGFWELPTATVSEAQEVNILMTTTGSNSVYIAGTTTGRFIMDEDDLIFCKYLNGYWRVINTTATIGAAT